jgi:hypothetical protein
MLIALGAFALNWSVMEMGLDFWAAVVWHQYGGKNTAKENPKNLGRKVEFLRKCQQDCPALEPVAAASLCHLDEVDALTTTRHHIVHGAVHGVGEDESLHLVRLNHDKRGFHTADEIILSIEEVEDGATRAKALAHQILSLAIALDGAARSLNRADETDGKLTV